MNNPDLRHLTSKDLIRYAGRIAPWATVAGVGVAMLSIQTGSHEVPAPGVAKAPEAAVATNSNPNGKKTIISSEMNGQVQSQPSRPENNSRKLTIVNGVEVVEPSAIFPENGANSSVYFCKDAPKGQEDLKNQFATNKYVRDALLAKGLNPNSAHFLSDQPMTISQTYEAYIKAGLSPVEAAKLADPKAQMSPYQMGGKVVLASVNFTGGDNVAKNPALFERQGLYNENQRLVWPVLFDHMPVIGGASVHGMSMAIMISAEYASSLSMADEYDSGSSAAVTFDAICCQPLTPGKPTPPVETPPAPTTPPKEEITPPTVVPPVVEVPPTPKPPFITEQPKPFTVVVCTGLDQNGKQVFITTTAKDALDRAKALGYGGSEDTTNVQAVAEMQQHLKNYCVEAPGATPTGTPTRPEGNPERPPEDHDNPPESHDNPNPTPTSTSPTVPGSTPSPTAPATNTAIVIVTVPLTPTNVPLQPTGQPTPGQPDATKGPIVDKTPAATNTPVRPGTVPPTAVVSTPTKVPGQPEGQPTPGQPDATKGPVVPKTPAATNTPVRQNPPTVAATEVVASPTKVVLQPTGQPTPKEAGPVDPTKTPVVPKTPAAVNTPVRQATSAPAPTQASSNPPPAPTPFR